MAFFGLLGKDKKETLDKGLEKSKESVLGKIGRAIAGKSTVDDDVLDNLEEALITSDVGVGTTLRIIERIQERVKRDKYLGTSELNKILVEETAALLAENDTADILDSDAPLPAKPYVIMVVGVNGVGKTTTIGKLAYQYKKAGSGSGNSGGSGGNAELVFQSMNQLSQFQNSQGLDFFNDSSDLFGCHYNLPPI